MSYAQILQGNAAFANKLYQILAREPGNVVFSPFSIHTIIAMAYQGSRDETSHVISQVLQIPDAKTTALAYKNILSQLKSENFDLCMANKIYVRQSEEFLREFETDVRECFESEVEMMDFEDKVEAVRKINEWVADATKQRIKEIVDEIDDDTAMFLVNAIYFKAEWHEHFATNSTEVGRFFLDEDTTVEVQMMNGVKNAYYRDNDSLDAEILVLPYQLRKTSMVIILSKTKNGIKDLEHKLASFDLSLITNGVYGARINVSLPKFGFEATHRLEDALKQIGLEVIFDKWKANFKGMVMLEPDENLCVDKILQKACIDVDEKGSEAAAVTAMRMRIVKKSRMVGQVVSFVVDHPAIFMVMEGQQNILFYGRLAHP